MEAGDLRAAIELLGQTAFNLPYAAFLGALGLDDDAYARDKYAALKTLAGAMAPFPNSSLVRLAQAYSEQ
jgi:hypothetical protein